MSGLHEDVKKENERRVIRKERERLGLMKFDQHALRYRGVMELAWAGCDDDEFASYSGHASKAMIIKYACETVCRKAENYAEQNKHRT